MLMHVKRFLRKFGFDVVRYRSFGDDILTPLAPKTILDIGANNGKSAQEMRKRFPHAQIYSFEPLQDCFRELTKKMAGDKNFQAFNVALGKESGESVIKRSSFHPSSSILTMSNLHKTLYPKSAGMSEERITIARLDDTVRDIKIEKPLFIKMDVQGFEAEVIKGGSETLKHAELVLMETSFVPLYENQPLFGDIHTLMQERGFEYRGRAESHYNKNTNELLYEDSVFVRKN